jgi:glycosyl transferase family 25
VLEDDAILDNNFDAVLDSLFDELKGPWDLVHLSGAAKQAVKAISRMRDYHLVRYSRIPSGTVGYLISQAGARKLLKPIVRHWPIDTDIRQPWQFSLDIYGVHPPIVAHDESLPSAILAYGDRSRLRRGIKPSRRYPTGNPLKTASGLIFNLRKLGIISWMACMMRNSRQRLGVWRDVRRRKAQARAPITSGA